MKNKLFITSVCSITAHNVILNGEMIYASEETDTGMFLNLLYKHIEMKYPKFYKMDNLSKLGLLSAEILLSNKSVNEKYLPEDSGVVLSNKNSSLDTDIKYVNTLKQMASPAVFVYTLPNIMIGEICIRNKFKGENAFFLSPEFDTQFIVPYVEDLFRVGAIKVCIMGWVECLDKVYKSALWLVESDTNSGTQFNVDNINKLYLNL